MAWSEYCQQTSDAPFSSKTKKMKTTFFLPVIFCLMAGIASGQGVAISEDPNPTVDDAALLDIQSTTKGVLIPRMTSTQRTSISAPPQGLLVFDYETQSFWFHTGGDWTELVSDAANHNIHDADGDTKVQVEEATDEDILRIDLGGTERAVLQHDGDNLRFDLFDDNGNLFLGEGAGQVNDPFQKNGILNTFIGQGSGMGNTGGSYNTFLGKSSGSSNTLGRSNTFIGRSAGTESITGNYNTLLGSGAGASNTTGSSNLFAGYQAGYLNTTGAANVFVGNKAGYYETDSNRLYIENSNVDSNHALIFGDFDKDILSVGGQLMVHIDGTKRFGFLVDTSDNLQLHIEDPRENIAIGKGTGNPENTGDKNIWIGDMAGNSNTSGNNNTTIGYKAGSENVTGQQNVFLGAYSGQYVKECDRNVFLGYGSGTHSDSTTYNTFAGYYSGYWSKGDRNTYIGSYCGYENNSGSHNTFIGALAGAESDMGDQNTIIGHVAGNNSDPGIDNVFIGDSTGRHSYGGLHNTFVGSGAGEENHVQQCNTFLGYKSGAYNEDGSENTFLGSMAGYNNPAGSGNVFIGSMAGYNEPDSNRLYIANDSTDKPLIYGEFENKELCVNGHLNIGVDNSDRSILSFMHGGVSRYSEIYSHNFERLLLWNITHGTIYSIQNGRFGIRRDPTTNELEVDGYASKTTAGDWLANSDQRLKKNIHPLDPDLMLEKMLQMQGVTYEWNDAETGYDRPEGRQYGFIAQDIQKVWPEKVFEDNQGYLMTAYGDYDPMVVEAIRALTNRIAELEAKIAAIEDNTE
jgi:hypothetical protein